MVISAPISISCRTARAFVLGLQGLWPGRRWCGADGARAALYEMGAVQVDPLNVIARNHELALHARVIGHELGTLETLLYQKREFFDYGGTVFVVPMQELPFFRVPMRRRAEDRRWSVFSEEHAAAIADARRQVAARGPLGSRDLLGDRTTPRGSFRSGKEAAQALYYLWLTGELMTHSRRGFERIYDFRDNVAPPAYRAATSADDADDHFARKALGLLGLATARLWYGTFCDFSRHPRDKADAKRRLTALLDTGVVTTVVVEGRRHPAYCLTEKVPLLEQVEAGDLPAAWRPVGPSSETQMTLLAPLDIVSARGRATDLFDFPYVWEVYKPAAQRRFGYYTMPVLCGDRLVARIDPAVDRRSRSMVVHGVWLEEPSKAADGAFLDALAAALVRLQRFVGAMRTEIVGPGPADLPRRLRALADPTPGPDVR